MRICVKCVKHASMMVKTTCGQDVIRAVGGTIGSVSATRGSQASSKNYGVQYVCRISSKIKSSSWINLLSLLHEPMLVAMPCSTDCHCVVIISCKNDQNQSIDQILCIHATSPEGLTRQISVKNGQVFPGTHLRVTRRQTTWTLLYVSLAPF